MPSYNHRECVEEAVESVLAQTYANFELIIVDDASTDGTLGLIKKYDDARIRLVEKYHISSF